MPRGKAPGAAAMPWTSKAKDISATKTTGHPSRNASLIARPPGVTTINFTPAEFFGAAARCCHLNVINPLAVTSESAMIQALIEQYVDDNSADFAILKTADNFKDYMKSYFAGTVAAGLAYLAMIADGYVWSDHFENVGGGNSKVTRTPDFVFARGGQGDAALVESKGTRYATAGRFDATVSKGYRRQIGPHLGYPVGTSTATHGYCIGAHLKSPTKAELNIHYTDLVAGGSPAGPATGPGTNSAVQRHNYATVFRLAHSEALAQQVRAARIQDDPIPFLQFDWLGRRWLTSHLIASLPAVPFSTFPFWPLGIWDSSFAAAALRAPAFALEASYALEILRTLSRYPEHFEVGFDLAPIPLALRRDARGGDGGAAIFPDGLAVITRRNLATTPRLVYWSRERDDLADRP